MKNEDRIICEFSGKELSGFKGTISLSPSFLNAFRVFSFYDCKFPIEKGMSNDDFIQKFIFTNGMGEEIHDAFPAIDVEIFSPHHKVPFGEPLQVIRFNYEEAIIDPSSCEFCEQADDVYEIMDGMEPDADINELPYYEFHLKTTLGKYRGLMNLDFSDIKNHADLKKKVYEKALGGFEFYETVEECFNNILFNPESISGVVKSSILYSDELDAYMKDLTYLLNKTLRDDDIIELIDRLNQQEFNSNSEFHRADGEKFILKDYLKHLASQKQEYSNLLTKITLK